MTNINRLSTQHAMSPGLAGMTHLEVEAYGTGQSVVLYRLCC
jgi:hypothetical protein